MRRFYQLSNNGITNNDLVFTDTQKDLLIYRMLSEGKDYTAKLIIGFVRMLLDNREAFNEFMQNEHFTYNYIICECVLKKIDGIKRTKKICDSDTKEMGIESNIEEIDVTIVRDELQKILHEALSEVSPHCSLYYKGVLMVPLTGFDEHEFDVGTIDLTVITR